MGQIKYLNGKPAIQQLEDDSNKVKLLEDFIVMDSSGILWIAPKGFVSDGESSPEAFEPLAGDPFSAIVLPGVVIHDKYCETRERTQEATHKIYYEILRHEIKNNKEFKWVFCFPWNNKSWQYAKAYLKWQALIDYNRLNHADWL